MMRSRPSARFVFLLMMMGFAPRLRAQEKPETLALTPPMGWNSWNKFQCNVSEELIRSVADGIASNGMKEAGYQYVVIDDCWQTSRDANGNIVADATRFPGGMKALADYVHAKGLKFGLYSDAGSLTCEKRPGSRGHEYQDAMQYARWGVDYLKYDWCNTDDNLNAQGAYATMRDALKSTGRAIVFSMCEWGSNKPWLWANGVAQLWRTTGDIHDCWDCDKEDNTGMTVLLDRNVGLEAFSGPGHWNDPDMLEVGNGGMTIAEYQAHFSLWAMLAAPLIAGNDVRNMKAEIRDILINKEVIAIDQDALGKQGSRIRKQGDLEVWSRPLSDGSRAVILFNRGKTSSEIRVDWREIGYPQHVQAKVRDLWAHRDMGTAVEGYSANVVSHGVVMIRVTP